MNRDVPERNTYKLSEGSIKTKNEFGEANKTVSLLYHRFKQIMGRKWDRKRLQSFRKLILRIIQSGPAQLTGQRKLWDGDINELLGYELNPKLSACKLFNAEISTEVEALKEIRVKIAPFNYMEAFKHHKDTVCAELKLYFLSFDLERGTSSGKSILAFSQAFGHDREEPIQISLPIADINNQITLVLKHIYFKRSSITGPSLIQDMRYMAAEIIATTYIKDGQLIEYQTEPKKTALAIADEQGVWQDMG